MSAAADSFVHLHTHSDYSLLHGALRVRDLASFAREQGMPAIALTDHGNLFGALEFHKECRRAGVKPILGMEAYVVRDRSAQAVERTGPVHRLVLLAATDRGWKNLMKLSSKGYLEGLSAGRPRIDKSLLREHAEGLIGLSAGPEGEVTRALRESDLGTACHVAGEYMEIFGSEHFFLEIQNHGLEWEHQVRSMGSEVARKTGARLVATNNCQYRSPEQAVSHDVLLAVQQAQTVDDPTRWRYGSDQYCLKSAGEMHRLFLDFPDAVANTLDIAERCAVSLDSHGHLLPEFPLPTGFANADEYLRHLSIEGARDHYGELSSQIQQRLEHELGIIRQTGFAGYFLIVGDFVRAAKHLGIPVGPGRGSAAGSLVCYCIGVTDVDPIAHDLLFERFLNPERVSMPDIDIDFCFERRDEIIDYVVQKYGASSVCQIITFGSMLARGVIRDVGRALGMGYGEVDRIAKLVPEQLGITLDKALDDSEELRAVREEDPRYDRLIHTALELEGLKRHSSIHAAGILIAPGDLIEHVPLYRSSRDEITTQWDMKRLEDAGLLKMDFLGLRTLTVIEKALAFLPELGGPQMRAEEIPLDDSAVFEMLGRGETVGVFQLESSGMQDVLRKLKPSSFDDITAVNALYRPGPLGAGMVDDFVDRKHGRKSIEVAHPMLQSILEPTYGVILYQEQVMRIASEMAGFSLGDADKLRRAMGKKKADEMAANRIKFVEGAVSRGVERATAQHIFGLMEYFAGYGFNKSHSASYAVLSVRTAWIKAHWPAAFMAAALTSEMSNTDRVVVLVEECRRLGLRLLAPDINTCTADFWPVGQGVRFGLGAVKNVGRSAIEAIVDSREKLRRAFRSLYELLEEVDLARVNRRVVENLVVAGALDGLPGRREQKLAVLDLALARAQRRAKERSCGQQSLFGAARTDDGPDEHDGVLPEVVEWTAKERLGREREAIGFYLTGHPLDDDRQLVQWLGPNRSTELREAPPDRGMILCGIITHRKIVTSRRSGQLVGFFTFEDEWGATEIIAFGEAYENHRQHLATDDVLIVSGRTTRRDEEREAKLILERGLPLELVCDQHIREIHVDLPVDVGSTTVDRILGAVAAHPGQRSLWLHVQNDSFEARVRARRAAIRPAPGLVRQLIAILGDGAVRLETVPLRALLAADAGNGRRRRAASGADR